MDFGYGFNFGQIKLLAMIFGKNRFCHCLCIVGFLCEIKIKS